MNPSVAPNKRLLIFAKYPQAGRVKTRLVPPLTHADAASLYRAFLLDTLELLRSELDSVAIHLLVDRQEDIVPMRELIEEIQGGDEIILGVQRGEGLGERLTNAFIDAFSLGEGRVCALGSDHPTLPVECLRQAFDDLALYDVVLGPVEDGGYYLLGLNRPVDPLFSDMPWSKPTLFASTVARAGELGLSVGMLRQWYDVDDALTLERLEEDREHLPSGGRIAAVLEAIARKREGVILTSYDHLPEGVTSVGIFGGTFDPIHVGHLQVAESTREELDLDLVLFVPAAIPPHKRDGRTIAPPECRLAMLRLAIAGNPGFAILTYEIEEADVSYTVETVEWLSEKNPGVALTLILGGDSVVDFHNWYRPRDIVRRAKIAVVARPGVILPDEALPGVGYIRVEAPLLDVSSSEIRERVRNGRSLGNRLPPTVIDYIEEHGLYR